MRQIEHMKEYMEEMKQEHIRICEDEEIEKSLKRVIGVIMSFCVTDFEEEITKRNVVEIVKIHNHMYSNRSIPVFDNREDMTIYCRREGSKICEYLKLMGHDLIITINQIKT